MKTEGFVFVPCVINEALLMINGVTDLFFRFCHSGFCVSRHNGARGCGRGATVPAGQRDELSTLQQAHSARSVRGLKEMYPHSSSCP